MSMFAPLLLAVGGIDYGTPAANATAKWRALPGTRDEAEEIENQLTGRLDGVHVRDGMPEACHCVILGVGRLSQAR